MNHDPIIEEIFHHAYAQALFEKAHELLCPACSKLFESEALARYRLKMAQRRKEISDLQMKAEKERQRESHRRSLEKQNKRNQKGTQ